jgi:hypothetical protein
MTLFFAINSKYVHHNKINTNDLYDIDMKAFKTLELLRDFINRKYKTFKGWYYITIPTNNKEDIVELNRGITLDLINNKPYPLMEDDKVWKYIPGFKRYMASNEGDILTLKTGNYTKGVSAGHYLKVSIMKDNEGVSKMQYVHILVCKTFHGLGKPGQVVMHKDDDKFNCREDNLRWGSQSENIQDVWNKRREIYNMENFNIIKELDEIMNKEESLRTYTNMLSMEEGFIKNINNYVIKSLTNTSNALMTNFSKLNNILDTNRLLDVSNIKSVAMKTSGDLKNIKYANIENRSSPVVIGLKVNLLVYNETMLKHIDVESKVMNIVDKTSNLLSNIISDESFRTSFKPRDLGIVETNKLIDDMRSDFSKLIDANGLHDRLQINKLVPNIASITPLANSTAILANKLKYNKMTEVKSKISEISEKIDMLVEYIETKDNNFIIAKNNIDALADSLDSAGELVTLYSTMYMLVNQQIGMVQNLVKIVKE